VVHGHDAGPETRESIVLINTPEFVNIENGFNLFLFKLVLMELSADLGFLDNVNEHNIICSCNHESNSHQDDQDVGPVISFQVIDAIGNFDCLSN